MKRLVLKKQNAGSIVDYLESKSKDSSFASRAALAKQKGVRNYTGTASQNTLLLNKLKSDNEAPKPKVNTRPAGIGTTANFFTPKVPKKSAEPVTSTKAATPVKNTAYDPNPFHLGMSFFSNLFNPPPPRGPGEPALESGFIVDKGKNEAYIIKDNKIADRFPVVTGKNPNTAMFANRSKQYLDDHPEGKVTPEGAFTSKWSGLIPGSEHYNLGIFSLDDAIDFLGMPKPQVDYAKIHQNYSDDRLPSYTNKSPEARRMSFGCVNCRNEDFIKLQQAMPRKDTVLIINSKTGKSIKDLGYKQSGGKIRLKPMAQDGTVPITKDPDIHGPIGYLNSYYDSPVFRKRFTAVNPGLMNGYHAVKYANRQATHYNPRFDDANKLGSYVPPHSKGEVVYDTKQAEKFGFDLENAVVPHEYSHLTRNLSLKDASLIASKNSNPRAPGLLSSYIGDRKKYSTGFATFLHNNKLPDSHEVSPHENYSDLNALRWMMYSNGYYDTRKGNLDLPTLQRALQDPNISNDYNIKRMLRNFTPEKIVELNNEVAQQRQPGSINLSQNAGKIKLNPQGAQGYSNRGDASASDAARLQQQAEAAQAQQADYEYRMAHAQGREGTIHAYKPQSTGSKIMDILSNPVSALQHWKEQGRVPDYLNKSGDRNILDNATDVLNPAFYANQAFNVGRQGKAMFTDPDNALSHFGSAGAHAMALMPLAEVLAPTISTAGNLIRRIPSDVNIRTGNPQLFESAFKNMNKATATESDLLSSGVGQVGDEISGEYLYQRLKEMQDWYKQRKTNWVKPGHAPNFSNKGKIIFEADPEHYGNFITSDLFDKATDDAMWVAKQYGKRPDYLPKITGSKDIAMESLSGFEPEANELYDILNFSETREGISDELAKRQAIGTQAMNDLKLKSMSNPIEGISPETGSDALSKTNPIKHYNAFDEYGYARFDDRTLHKMSLEGIDHNEHLWRQLHRSLPKNQTGGKVVRSMAIKDDKDAYAQGTYRKDWKDLNDFQRTMIGPYVNKVQPFPKVEAYEPSEGLKTMKGVTAGASLASGWVPPVEYAFQLAGAGADAYTAARYAKDGQGENAAVDLGQTLIGLIPYSQYFKSVDGTGKTLSQVNKFNKRLKLVQGTSDANTIKEKVYQNAGTTKRLVKKVKS